MEQGVSMGVIGFWAQSDAIGRTAALLLLAMSVVSWYLIVTKAWQTWRTRRLAQAAVDAFWGGSNLQEAVARMQAAAPDSPFTSAAVEGANALAHFERTLVHLEHPLAHHERHVAGRLAETMDISDFITRAIRRAIGRASAGVESGLAVLASVGATSPFIGLFGTVWGIYHALIGIGFTGQASLDKVAGPVGEALIMTAFGIAVAVPAVLAYNALTRANRIILGELDGFAHDLDAYLATGARLASRPSPAVKGVGAPVTPLQPRNASQGA